MLICAMDTSGREGSIALVEGDASSFLVLRFMPIAGGTYSAQLIPQISKALDECGRAKSDIKLLVAASGPGSFTGLRVGLSTVKALTEVLNAPIVAVSVLEAIAYAVNGNGVVLSVLDAQRNEVFVGEYQSIPAEGGSSVAVRQVHEALLPIAEFTTWLGARAPVPVSYTPDVSVEKKIRESGSPAEFIARPGADVYARIGLQKYLAGDAVAAETLDANYIRRSDAEIFSLPKLSAPPK